MIRLYFIRNNMTVQRYRREVVEVAVLPYLRILQNIFFEQDNARPHVANVTLDCFTDNQVSLLPWIPRSLDLSLIKHVWYITVTRLLNLRHPLETLTNLLHEVQVGRYRYTILQEKIDHLIFQTCWWMHTKPLIFFNYLKVVLFNYVTIINILS